MNLDDNTRQRIDQMLEDNRVVLFMKGSPKAPMCGFSAQAVGILDNLLGHYQTFNVLEDESIRQGIKTYGNWPTIPQLYIDKELIGGSDIISELFNAGELHEMLGLEAPDRTPPQVTITEAAAAAISEGMSQDPSAALHFAIDGSWQNQFFLKPASGHEIVAESNGIKLHMDLNTAQRANGIVIDWVEELDRSGLDIQNPNAPAPVMELSVTELKSMVDAGTAPKIVDVRPPQDREKAPLEVADFVMDRDDLARLNALDPATPVAFICHHGKSSMGAAEHYRQQGFTNVYNVAGGIDAWSQQVDPSIPRY